MSDPTQPGNTPPTPLPPESEAAAPTAPASAETVSPAPAPPAPNVPAQKVTPASPPIPYAMPAARSAPAIPKSAGCLVKMLLGFGLVIPIGYFALMAMSPKARDWATSEDGPTPFKALNQILAIPAQALGKTKDVVAANDARVGVLDKVIAEEEGKNAKPVEVPVETGPPLISADAIATEKAPPALTEIKLGGGIVAASASPEGAPPASQPFLYWVASLRISGVLQGSPARIRVNNVLTREGQMVNPTLGITFDHLEPAKKLMVFRDKSGACVSLSY